MSKVGKEKVYIWTISSRLSTNIRRQSIFVQKQQVLTKILVLLLDFKVLLFTEKDSNKFHTVSVVYLASVVNAVV